MSKLKGLLLTQGMHGMISQVEGLAKALDLDFIHHKVELNNFWKIVPPKLTPISQNIYKKINEYDFDVITFFPFKLSCSGAITKSKLLSETLGS